MKNKDTGKISVRYARALIEATNQSDLELVEQALTSLAAAWSSNLELRSAILNPAITISSRELVLKDLIKNLLSNNSDASKKFENFTTLLLHNGRIDALPEIAEQFRLIMLSLKKSLAVSITSAYELSAAEKQSLNEQLKNSCGAMTTVTWSVDNNLIGGMLIKAGDKVLDNTIRGSLEQLRQDLLQ